MSEEAIYIPDQEPIDNLRIAKDLFAGTISGIAQVLVGQPFDTIKVRLASDTTGQYKDTTDAVKQLISKEGPFAFYKGTLTPLIGVGACVSLQFAANEYMKRVVFAGRTDLSNSQFYASGAVAGFTNTFLATPIEHIRTRLQTQIKGNLGPLDMIKSIYKQGGVGLLNRGFFPCAIRESHGLGVYFMTFEYLVKRDQQTNYIQRKEIPGLRLCLYGALSGYCMWLTAYPIDYVKSRLQTDSLNNPKYKTSLDVIRDTLKTSGVKGFFRGFVPTILRAGPANAATFYAFELTMRAIN
ncbi:hypothetical protein WICPIJ_008346 [Wickerhamomyces pijperi]|uniref:Carrier protein YMC1, mitochondrial n=1 Tax=Wickerhamomyces pijperi TaxID=599730 RepID=A0A9P8PXS8_WICPI|nr:hypothetical protein WICPIJ_008346 [Wickerhamomyces pijperi]